MPTVIDDESRASRLCETNTGASGAAVTLTLPAPPAGFVQYVTHLKVTKFAAALLTAAATPVVVTSTNLPGSPAWSFSAGADLQGTTDEQTIEPATPMRATAAGTAVTIVCPGTTSVIWRATAMYFNSPA